MPVSKLTDLPAGGGGRWPATADGFRSIRWGDFEVGFTTAGPLDCTTVYAGLPGGVCPCPHWGYVFTGRFRATFPDRDRPDEVAEAGDVYYFEPGHVLVYDEPSEVLEFNPSEALTPLMDHIQRSADGPS
jgi:hypothetical protein